MTIETEVQRIQREAQEKINALRLQEATEAKARIDSIMESLRAATLPSLAAGLEVVKAGDESVQNDFAVIEERYKALADDKETVITRQRQQADVRNALVHRLMLAFQSHNWLDYWTNKSATDPDGAAVAEFKRMAAELLKNCPDPASTMFPAVKTTEQIIEAHAGGMARRIETLPWSAAARGAFAQQRQAAAPSPFGPARPRPGSRPGPSAVEVKFKHSGATRHEAY